MNALADEWESLRDRRAIFLRCYGMMTANMVKAVEAGRFADCVWVDRLLHRFADYYFDALACFDCGENVPAVWRYVHEAAANRNLHVIQHLLLGVNAHINYDLVLTLVELLEPDWKDLSIYDRQSRYHDHQMVNTIIAETIDEVQDEVVEKYSPLMDLIDTLMGRLDEKLLVGMISNWRDGVWDDAMKMLLHPEINDRQLMISDLETEVLKKARSLELRLW